MDVTYNFQPASTVRGYLLGGIGFYRVKFSVTSSGVTADTSATKFAWNVGAGVVFRVALRGAGRPGDCATAQTSRLGT